MLRLFGESGPLFVITGATGWLGRATLDLLDAELPDAFPLRVAAYSTRPVQIALRSGRSITTLPHDTLDKLERRRCVFLHYAFLTREHASAMSLVEYIDRNRSISARVLDAAARNETVGVFLPSSGAVYGPGRALSEDVEVNPYGVLKLKDEAAFTDCASAARCPLVIARVFNLSGWGINKVGSYALGSILSDILRGRPVTLRATHRVVRSYVDIQDLIRLVLFCLSEGRQRFLFDTAGEVEIEVGDLARLALGIMGLPGGEILRPALNDGKEDRYVGDPGPIKMLADKFGVPFRSLEQQLLDTAAFLATD